MSERYEYIVTEEVTYIFEAESDQDAIDRFKTMSGRERRVAQYTSELSAEVY